MEEEKLNDKQPFVNVSGLSIFNNQHQRLAEVKDDCFNSDSFGMKNKEEKHLNVPRDSIEVNNEEQSMSIGDLNLSERSSSKLRNKQISQPVNHQNYTGQLGQEVFDYNHQQRDNPLVFKKGNTKLLKFESIDENKSQNDDLNKEKHAIINSQINDGNASNRNSPRVVIDVQAADGVQLITPRGDMLKASRQRSDLLGNNSSFLQPKNLKKYTSILSYDDLINNPSSYHLPFEGTPRYLEPQIFHKQESSTNDAIFWQQTNENQIAERDPQLISDDPLLVFDKKPKFSSLDHNFLETAFQNQNKLPATLAQPQFDNSAPTDNIKQDHIPLTVTNNLNQVENKDDNLRVRVYFANNILMPRNSGFLSFKEEDVYSDSQYQAEKFLISQDSNNIFLAKGPSYNKVLDIIKEEDEKNHIKQAVLQQSPEHKEQESRQEIYKFALAKRFESSSLNQINSGQQIIDQSSSSDAAPHFNKIQKDNTQAQGNVRSPCFQFQIDNQDSSRDDLIYKNNHQENIREIELNTHKRQRESKNLDNQQKFKVEKLFNKKEQEEVTERRKLIFNNNGSKYENIQLRKESELKSKNNKKDVKNVEIPKTRKEIVKPMYEQEYEFFGNQNFSLYIFGPQNKIREKTQALVASNFFEYGMIIIIVLNSLSLAFYDYKDRESKSSWNQVIDKINIAFTILFLIEAILRIIAHGFIMTPNSYLRNGWNLIDATVVIAGLIEMSFNTMNLKSLRVIRVFRPLKSINTIQSMKKLILALIRSIPQFANVVVFLVFMFILFATIGLHQYNGAFYNACRLSPDPESSAQWTVDLSEGRVCSTSGLGGFICPKRQYCRNPSDNSTYDYLNEKMDDRAYVNYGITNFDNLGRAILTVFQIVTSDTWYQQMDNLMDVDIPFLGGLYCLVLIILGQFFLMNLILAVIIFAFVKSQKESLQDEVKAYQEEKIKEQTQKIQVNFKHEIISLYKKSGAQRRKNSAPHLEIDSKNQLKMEIREANAQSLIEIDEALQNQENGFERKRTAKFRKSIKNMNINRLGEVQKKKLNRLKSQLVRGQFVRANSGEFNKIFQQVGQKQVNEEHHITTFLKSKVQKRKVANLLMNLKKMPGVKPEPSTPKEIKVNADNKGQVLDEDKTNFNELQDETKQGLAQIFKLGREKKERERAAAEAAAGAGQQQQESYQISGLNKMISFGPVIANAGKEDGQKEDGEETNKNNEESNKNGGGLTLMQRLMKKKGSSMALNTGDENNQQNSQSNYDSESENGEDENKSEGSVKSSKNGAGGGLFKKIFRQYIEKKIEEEYKNYFDTVLKEASQNVNSDQTNMREVVGIKVGLEYIRQQQQEKERNLQQKRVLFQRKKSNRVYNLAFKIQNHKTFNFFMVTCIIANTLILSLDHYPVDNNEQAVLEKLNYLFTSIFTVELMIKIAAYGFKTFFKGEWFNIFDSLIVVASLIDIIISSAVVQKESDSLTRNGSVITALRGFRLLRIFKLARTWKRFELLLETMAHTLQDVASFSILLFLYIFIFTLLGMELFAWRAKLDPETNYVDLINGESPTFNFDNFLNSFSLVFIILTNDGTSAIYYNHYRSVSALNSTIYFVALVLIGQKIILNLFVAILLENFDEGVLRQKMHDYEQKQRQVIQKQSWSVSKWKKFKQMIQKIASRNRIMKTYVCCCFLKKKSNEYENSQDKKAPIKLELGLMQIEKKHTAKESIQTKLNYESGSHDKHEVSIIQGRSLFLLSDDSIIRKTLHKLITHNYYDWFIILIIIINSIQLALDNPLVDPDSKYALSLYYIDFVSTIIFIVEAAFKALTYGLYFCGDHSYLRSSWNQLDFVIIVFSIMAITPLSSDFKAFKVFRILRLISRNNGLQVAVRSLILGLPNILNVTIIMLLFFLIFGVISVSQFKGRFYYCEGPQKVSQGEVNSKWDCVDAGGEWINQIYNFDDIPNAMITLFVMSTTAGWQDVLVNTITAGDLDYVQVEYRSPFWSFFYILFLIVGFFFFLNLFIGVVVTNFNTEKDKIGGNDLLTEKQREWIDLKLLVLRSAPIKKIMPPNNKFRLFFFKIQSSPKFERFIFISILINTILLMLKWYQQADIIVQVLEIMNYIFTAIFALEAIIKIIAQGLIVFFREGWNIFDFLVAFASGLSIIVSAHTSLEIKGAITLLRSFRILRILRLLKRGGKNLYMIFNTFVITLQSLVNIGALLLLIIYMYSVLGMILFGSSMRTGLMNNYMNFENFINAFLTLFTVTTGDSWNATQTSFVVYESPLQQCIWNPTFKDYQDAGKTVGCGGKVLAYIFFTSYYFIVSLIFLQLFIAVILQGYDNTQIQEARLFNNEMNLTFRQIWADFDPDATTFMNIGDFRAFLFQLGSPLGFDEIYKNDKFLQDKFIASLDLPIYYEFSKYQFLDVLEGLSFRLMVLDHIKQQAAQTKDGDQNKENSNQESVQSKNNYGDNGVNMNLRRMSTVSEEKIKDQISKEINKLMYQKNNENITAVQDVIAKELNQKRTKNLNMDHCGLTSSHHMAAEDAVRKMKAFVTFRREDRMGLRDGAEIKARATEFKGHKTANIVLKNIKQGSQDDKLSNYSSLRRFNWNNGYGEDEDEESNMGRNQLDNSLFASSLTGLNNDWGQKTQGMNQFLVLNSFKSSTQKFKDPHSGKEQQRHNLSKNSSKQNIGHYYQDDQMTSEMQNNNQNRNSPRNISKNQFILSNIGSDGTNRQYFNKVENNKPLISEEADEYSVNLSRNDSPTVINDTNRKPLHYQKQPKETVEDEECSEENKSPIDVREIQPVIILEQV